MTEKYIPIIDLASALYIDQLQELENLANIYFNMVNINSAIGDQLNIVGGYVNLKRNGMDDDTYKLFIKAEIIATSSKGRINELLTALDLLTENENSYIVPYTKAIDVYADVSTLLGQYILEFLERAVDAGVNVMTVQPASTDGLFGFEGDITATTFGDLTDSSVGGNFSYIITGG